MTDRRSNPNANSACQEPELSDNSGVGGSSTKPISDDERQQANSSGMTNRSLNNNSVSKTISGSKRKIGTCIDESLLDEESARKLEARRAYNRECAAKARKRSKELIASLQEQVEQLTQDKAALERSNEVMRAQLDLLEQQNRTLMTNQRPAAPAAAPTVLPTTASVLEQHRMASALPSTLFMPSSAASAYFPGSFPLLDAAIQAQELERLSSLTGGAGGANNAPPPLTTSLSSLHTSQQDLGSSSGTSNTTADHNKLYHG